MAAGRPLDAVSGTPTKLRAATIAASMKKTAMIGTMAVHAITS
jgi:hypothetical protein